VVGLPVWASADCREIGDEQALVCTLNDAVLKRKLVILRLLN
jgi:hypothetical protein